MNTSIQTNPTSPSDHGPNTPLVQSILVVDDERSIVHLLHDLLESEGYRVEDAFNGDEAMGILRRRLPHLVISDIEMPRGDGRDLVRFLDQVPDASSPKLILMSAGNQRVTGGRIPFIGKPFDIEDLLDLVDTVLDPAQAQQATGNPS